MNEQLHDDDLYDEVERLKSDLSASRAECDKLRRDIYNLDVRALNAEHELHYAKKNATIIGGLSLAQAFERKTLDSRIADALTEVLKGWHTPAVWRPASVRENIEQVISELSKTEES